nr:hypothetical protein [uncultured Shinella sp.]
MSNYRDKSRQFAYATLIVFGAASAGAASAVAASLERPVFVHHTAEETSARKGKPTYITDVTGRHIRLVGPRFLTNPANAIAFPGRTLDSDGD